MCVFPIIDYTFFSESSASSKSDFKTALWGLSCQLSSTACENVPVITIHFYKQNKTKTCCYPAQEPGTSPSGAGRPGAWGPLGGGGEALTQVLLTQAQSRADGGTEKGESKRHVER